MPGSITKNIIFKIGQSGSAATAAKIAVVTAAVGLLAKKTWDATKHAERFRQMTKRATADMSTFGQETKGLIDTFESFKSANRLTAAGINATEEQINSIGKAAIELARSTDGNATAAFDRLTSSVAKGSTRALKELGIDIENTEDLVAAQAEALDKIVKKYNDYSISIETAEERMFRLKNVAGTLKDQLMLGILDSFAAEAGTAGSLVNELTEKMEWFSKAIDNSNGKLAQWVFSLDGVQHSAKLLGNTIFDILIPFTDQFAENIEVLNSNFDKMATKMQYIGLAAKRLKGVGATVGINLVNELKGAQVTLEENQRMLDEMAAIERKSFSRKGKKGGTKRESISSDIVAESMRDRVDANMSILESIQAQEIKHEEDREKILSQAENKRIKILQSSVDEFGQLKRTEAETRILILESEIETASRLRENARSSEEKKEFQHQEQMLSIQKAHLQQQVLSEKIKQRNIDAIRLGGLKALSDLSVLMNAENKKAFVIGKVAAIAEATISTALGAQKAFTSLAGVPVIGPALGASAASASSAAGAVRIKQISNTKFGGTSSIAASSPSFSSAAASTASVNAPAQDQIIDRRPIILNIDGRQVGDAMIIDQINRQKRGERGMMIRL